MAQRARRDAEFLGQLANGESAAHGLFREGLFASQPAFNVSSEDS